MKNKYLMINLCAHIGVFITNIVINLFLTPYALEKLGSEAYGYIGLINNIVSYVNVVTVALNSLAGRYISLAFFRNNKEEANEYFSSVYFANLLLSGIVLLLSGIVVINIDILIKVQDKLLPDVQLAFMLAILNLIISMISVVYSVAAFIRNKLYLNSLSQLVASVVRVSILIVLYAGFNAHIWYYSLAAIIYSVLIFIAEKIITVKICPELNLSLKKFRINRVLDIVKSGAWTSLESLNKILQTGLDLLIANLFVSEYATGLLSIAKTIPNALVQLPPTIVSIFYPQLAKLYAASESKKLVAEFKFTIRFLSLLLIVPLIGFVSFGTEFFSLWLSLRTADEVEIIQKLSILTILPLLINAYIEGLYYANILTNKIKGSVLISFGFSSFSIVVEVILLKFFPNINPLYVIAGTSSMVTSIRNLIVTPAYCSYVLKQKLNIFWWDLGKVIATSLAIYLLYYFVEQTITINSWAQLIIYCGTCGIVGYLIEFYALLNRYERVRVKNKIISKFKK